jgi:ribosome maturation factor RimP
MQGEIALSAERKDAIASAIEKALADPLQALGFDIEAVEITPAGKRRILRIAVDKDGGITHEEVTEATREVNRVLDESDVMGEQPYTLEVTSPGTDRPLTHPRHWRRNRGRLVKVTLAGGRTVTGRIGETDDEAAVLDVDGSTTPVRYEDVAKAKVELEFNRKES